MGLHVDSDAHFNTYNADVSTNSAQSQRTTSALNILTPRKRERFRGKCAWKGQRFAAIRPSSKRVLQTYMRTDGQTDGRGRSVIAFLTNHDASGVGRIADSRTVSRIRFPERRVVHVDLPDGRRPARRPSHATSKRTRVDDVRCCFNGSRNGS